MIMQRAQIVSNIVLEPGDKFSLWLGEAKFYDSIDDTRLTSIVTSVYNTLSTDKIKKKFYYYWH